MGRAAVHARAEGAQRDSDAGETGRRGGRGKAGHRPRQPGRGERGNPPKVARSTGQPGRWWAGPPSAVGLGWGRSRRSTRRPGEPVTGGRAAASPQQGDWKAGRSPVNTGASWPTLSLDEAEARVLGIQAKLHRRANPPAWARGEPGA